MQKRIIFLVYLCIVQMFFVLYTSAQTVPSSWVFSKDLQLNDTGIDVSSLQKILITRGFLPLDTSMGLYGKKTFVAVKKWQKSVGLLGTGFFGPQSRTYMRTSELHTKITTQNSIQPSQIAPQTSQTNLVSEKKTTAISPVVTKSSTVHFIAPGSNNVTNENSVIQNSKSKVFTRDLKIDDTGSDVVILQKFLISKGFLPGDKSTGYFGDLTRKALQTWQLSEKVPNTGYFGPLSQVRIQQSSISEFRNKNLISSTIPVPQNTSSDVKPNTQQSVFSTASPSASLNTELHPLATPTSVPIAVATLSNVSVSAQSQPIFAQLFSGGGGGNSGGNGGGSGGGNAPAPQPTPEVTPQPQQVTPTPAPDFVNAKPSTLSDTISPTISISNPGNNTTVSSTVSVTANATDNIGVVSVQFLLDGANLLGILSNTNTYQIVWDTLTSTVGNHIISAIARDAAGNSKTAADVTVIVARPLDTISPTVSIISPVSNTTTSDPLNIQISASDNIKVTNVELYIDNVLNNQATLSPYIFTLATSSLSGGSHTLYAKAYDAAGNTASTPLTTINVPVSGPSIPQQLIVTSIDPNAITLGWSRSTEPRGTILGYKLFRGNTQIATTPFISYVDTPLTSNTTYTYSVSAVDTTGITSLPSSSVSVTTSKVITPSTLNYNFGTSVGDNLLVFNDADMNKELDAMAALGVGWLRFDMEWRNVQWKSDDPNFFDWAGIDRLVAAAAAHKIKILAILGYAPVWAEVSTCPSNIPFCAPANLSLFATFAKTAAQRYSSQGVTSWEIWNEPNNAFFWGPNTSCSTYTAMLKLTYTAIKQADPQSTVITGGLAPEPSDGSSMTPTDFLNCIYSNGGKNYFDAVGHHPYTFPQFPSDSVPHAWQQMSITTPSLRSIMVANGDGNKKIWFTEFGAPTNGPDSNRYISESLQSQMVTDAYNVYKNLSWTGPLFWYTMHDSGYTTDTIENFFGLLRFDGSFKPAYTTLKNLISGQ